MVKSKTVSIIAIGILIISMLGGLIVSKKALAVPQHYIILPFHTSWENSDRAFGRSDSVDYSKDFSSPKLGYQDTGYGGVATPPDDSFQGYHFGTRFLVAEGYFGSIFFDNDLCLQL